MIHAREDINCPRCSQHSAHPHFLGPFRHPQEALFEHGKEDIVFSHGIHFAFSGGHVLYNLYSAAHGTDGGFVMTPFLS